MIIDIHGHYTTAPKALEDWRNRQIASLKDGSGSPQASELKISDDEIREALSECVATIMNAIRVALERTPPELSADIVRNGIYLTGGGALLRGLDKRLTDKIGIPFKVVDDPLHVVAKGTGIALRNIDKFSFLMR